MHSKVSAGPATSESGRLAILRRPPLRQSTRPNGVQAWIWRAQAAKTAAAACGPSRSGGRDMPEAKCAVTRRIAEPLEPRVQNLQRKPVASNRMAGRSSIRAGAMLSQLMGLTSLGLWGQDGGVQQIPRSRRRGQELHETKPLPRVFAQREMVALARLRKKVEAGAESGMAMPWIHLITCDGLSRPVRWRSFRGRPSQGARCQTSVNFSRPGQAAMFECWVNWRPSGSHDPFDSPTQDRRQRCRLSVGARQMVSRIRPARPPRYYERISTSRRYRKIARASV